MFEHLKSFSLIFVTGPQRSGTTICGKMIAADTGHEYMDEFRFGVVNKQIFESWIKDKENVVVQCPTMCRFIHEIVPSDSLVVFMRRPIEEIEASQKRINWKCAGQELERYSIAERAGFTRISDVKYHFWDTVQKKQVRHFLEITHESLKAHKLWVDADLRRNFGAKQTEPRKMPFR